MASLHETPLVTEFDEEEFEEIFASKPCCIAFVCFGSQVENPRRTEYRSLLHEGNNNNNNNNNIEKWWNQRSRRAKEHLSGSVARLGWQKAAAVHGENLKRRKVVYSYSFRSYALNFDEGNDLAGEMDEVRIQVSGVN